MFPHLTSKDFSGAKLINESERRLYHLGFFEYKQQILSNLSENRPYWKTIG